jgi:hypothetical protein
MPRLQKLWIGNSAVPIYQREMGMTKFVAILGLLALGAIILAEVSQAQVRTCTTRQTVGGGYQTTCY